MPNGMVNFVLVHKYLNMKIYNGYGGKAPCFLDLSTRSM